ncbi:MAG: ExeA family protein [Burkholderiaceae bacterium]
MSNKQILSRPVYLDHFGLNTSPFRLTPAIDCFYSGADRAAMLTGMTYALMHSDGIIAVTGEVGSGKTTLSRVLMSRASKLLQFVYISNPAISRDELQLAVAHELHLSDVQKGPSLLGRIQRELIALHATGRQVVLLVDEAHEMPCATLQEIRLLTNLETSASKLLQVVLIGQPELVEALATPALRPLRERITHHFRVESLNAAQSQRYLSFRVQNAGGQSDLFSPRAARKITRASHGLARRMNILAEKSLLAAYCEQADQVSLRHVRMALDDSAWQLNRPGAWRQWVRALGRLIAFRGMPRVNTSH